MPVFLVRSSLPDVSAGDLQAAADRAAGTAGRMGLEGFRIRYLQSTYVPADGWFGCLYEADDARDVRLANERAAIPFEGVVEAVLYMSGGSKSCRCCTD
jgi:uncharacterized protein DUF4242